MHPRKNANPMIDKIFFFTMYASLVAQLNTSTEQVCSFQFSLTWPLLGAPVPRTRILTRRTLSSCSQHEAPKVKTTRIRPIHPSVTQPATLTLRACFREYFSHPPYERCVFLLEAQITGPTEENMVKSNRSSDMLLVVTNCCFYPPQLNYSGNCFVFLHG